MMEISQQKNKESRSGLLQFLEDALNNKNIQGLEWIDREKKIWQLPWKHHRPTRWGDRDAFVLREIGKHMYGFTGTEPAQEDLKHWKEKFRNALRSLGVKELEEFRNQEGDNPIKVYQFNNEPVSGRKTRGRKQGETGIARRSNKQNQLLNLHDMSCSSSSSDVFDQTADYSSFLQSSYRSRSPVHEFSDINTDGFSGNLDSMTPNIPHDFIGGNGETPYIPHDLAGGNNLNAVGATFRSSSIPILSPLVADSRNILENSLNNCSKILAPNTALLTNLPHSNGLVENNLSRLPAHQMNASGGLIPPNIPNMVFLFNKENHHKGINSPECLDGIVCTKNASGLVMDIDARYKANNLSRCNINYGTRFELNNGGCLAVNNGECHDITNGAGYVITNVHAVSNSAGHAISNDARHDVTNGAGHAVTNGASYMPSSLDMIVPLDYHFMDMITQPEELDLPLMVLEVKYYNEIALFKCITEDTFRICYVPNSQLREVIASCPSAEQFGPRDSKLIELPSAHLCPNLNEQQIAVTQGVLNKMERGVTIFYRHGDIYAKRLCQAVPFHYIPNEMKSQKLERENEVKIFDFQCNFLNNERRANPFVFLSFSVRYPDRVKAPVLSVKISHMQAIQKKRKMHCIDSVPLEPECSLSNEFDTRLRIQQNLLS